MRVFERILCYDFCDLVVGGGSVMRVFERIW